MHGTLEVTYKAVKFNFQQVLLKTLIPTMNTLKDMAVLNIIKTDGKKLFTTMNNKKVRYTNIHRAKRAYLRKRPLRALKSNSKTLLQG